MISCTVVYVDLAGAVAAAGAALAAIAATVHARHTRRIVERRAQAEAMQAALRRARGGT